MILNKQNKNRAKKFFHKIIDMGLEFKLKDQIIDKYLPVEKGKKMITNMPVKGMPVEKVLREFEKNILPYCTNFCSSNFMGFPDSCNSVASIGGSLLYNFIQQNLINQSFCAPSASFTEIAVIRWLREIVGYKNKPSNLINDIWDVGGVITPGGTSSNAIGILMARENKFPGTMEHGVADPNKCQVVVPKAISHYSVKSGQMWAGCGNKLIEVETKDFRYDLSDLKKKLEKNKSKVMCVVAYAGDSRTMTVDYFDKIYKIVKAIDSGIWLHADACHGFSLGLSDKLKYKLKGLEQFDSVTADPHKVFMTPYVISALLIKDPKKIKTVASLSDLIMQEPFAFGQATPFLGSKSWQSLKLWFLIKNLGKEKMGRIIEARHNLAKYLAERLSRDDDFLLINKADMNSVVFLYTGQTGVDNLARLNEINKKIHDLMLREGKYHLHQFSLSDAGAIKKGTIIYPQRFMCGNPNTTKEDVKQMMEYVRKIGRKCEKSI